MSIAIQNTQDVSQVTLTSLTEEKLAAWLIHRGARIIRHQGRYWMATHPGFYTATHPLARMSLPESTRPTPLCWGFRTSLCEADAAKANGSMPLHLLTDVPNYTWQTRSTRCRNKLRNLRKQVCIVGLPKPDLLLEQGYNILSSAHARNGYGRIPGPTAYRKNIERYYDGGCCLVLGGLVDGKLGGYMTSYAVGTTAYVDEVFLHSAYLRSNISLGLFFEWMQICRQAGSIHEIVHGQHAREAPGLCRYKEELGLSVVQVPTRIWFAPLTGRIVKKLRPHAYYRLTGHN